MTRVRDLVPSGALTGIEKFYADSGAADVYATADQIKTYAGGGIAKLGWVTPQDYYADAGQPGHTADRITQDDIDAHPEWICGPGGSYKVGSYWSYVALQEAILGAFAYYDSTPGSLVWNKDNSRRNKVLYIPPGDYNIDHRLLMVAQEFNFMCAGRGSAKIYTYTGRYIVGDSHGTITIDGCDPAEVAQLDPWDDLYVTGPGISGVTYVEGASGDTITLTSPTTTSETGGEWYLYSSGLYCDSAAYGAFHSLSMHCQKSLPDASQELRSRLPAMFVLNGTGAYGGLKTQQITLYDLLLNGSSRADVCMSISPAGGGAQGDTILLVNPMIMQSVRVGLACTGANCLNVQVINGNFQTCRYAGIQTNGSSVYVNGTSFQPGIFHLGGFSPETNSVANMSADINLSGGGGPSSTSDIQAIRSEGAQSVWSFGGAQPTVSNYGTADVESLGWYATYNFKPGYYIANAGTPYRTFMVVDGGGTLRWHLAGAFGSGLDTVTLVGANYATDSLVGLRLYRRFTGGQTGMVGYVDSNTADTVTSNGMGITVSPGHYFFVGGITGADYPTDWSTCGNSVGVFDTGAGVGINTTAGSDTIHIGNGFPGVTVGDYIVVPQAARLGATQAEAGGVGDRLPPVRHALIAKILASLGSGDYTISIPADYTMSEASGWCQCTGFGGDVVVDGDITWMPIDTFTFVGCGSLDRVVANRIKNCKQAQQVRSSGEGNWLYTELKSTGDFRNVTQGQTLIMPTADLSSAASPLDVSSTVAAGDVSHLTPTQDLTLTAATGWGTAAVQRWRLIIVTSGTTSYTLTFGTGFRSTGTLATGATSGKYFIVDFMTVGYELVEISRTGAM